MPSQPDPTLESYHQWLERLWAGGVVRSELSGPQGAIAECNTPGPKARGRLNYAEQTADQTNGARGRTLVDQGRFSRLARPSVSPAIAPLARKPSAAESFPIYASRNAVEAPLMILRPS